MLPAAGFVGFAVVLFTTQQFAHATAFFVAGLLASSLVDAVAPEEQRARELRRDGDWHQIRTLIVDD